MFAALFEAVNKFNTFRIFVFFSLSSHTGQCLMAARHAPTWCKWVKPMKQWHDGLIDLFYISLPKLIVTIHFVSIICRTPLFFFFVCQFVLRSYRFKRRCTLHRTARNGLIMRFKLLFWEGCRSKPQRGLWNPAMERELNMNEKQSNMVCKDFF